MKWLITGSGGQLGHAISQALIHTRPDDDVVAMSRKELDICDHPRVETVLSTTQPDVVINCAAWTKVDLAESHEDDAMLVNAEGPAVLADSLARLRQGILVQISTDYVFGGGQPGPHRETDTVEPMGVYARSKASAEFAVRERLPERHAIVRTAWLYGEYGSNFAKTIIQKILTDQTLRVVDDQLGQPTYTHDVAGRVIELSERVSAGAAPAGTYHAVNTGSATWWQFAAAIAELMHRDPGQIERISTAALDLPAQRPKDSRLLDLEGAQWGLTPMRPWREALTEAIPTLRHSL